MADLHSAVEWGSCKKSPLGCRNWTFVRRRSWPSSVWHLELSPTEMDALTHLETNGRMDLRIFKVCDATKTCNALELRVGNSMLQ